MPRPKKAAPAPRPVEAPVAAKPATPAPGTPTFDPPPAAMAPGAPTFDDPPARPAPDAPADRLAALKPGFVLMRSETASGCSLDGRSYQTDADGFVAVPEGPHADLLAHGFRLA